MSNDKNYPDKNSDRSREEKISDWLQTIGTWATSLILIGLTVQQMNSNNEDQQNRVMADYVKQMTVLRVEQGLSPTFLSIPPQDSKERAKQEQVKLAARDIALNAARQLDGKRKGLLLKYLYDTKLIGVCPPDGKTSQLNRKGCLGSFIELSYIELKDVISPDNILPNDTSPSFSLNGINLQTASLQKANLSNAILMGVDLSGADLRGAKMDKAVLESGRMIRAKLQRAELKGANLQQVVMRGSRLKGTDLSNADLRRADLRGTDFSEAQLSRTKLEGAFYNKSDEANTYTGTEFSQQHEQYKKVMRLCPSDIPQDSNLHELDERCAAAPL